MANSIPTPGKFAAGPLLKMIYSVAMFAGLILAGLSIAKDPARGWHAYLTGYMYFTNIALGGLFFAAIQHVANAGWSVTVRRIFESLTAFLPIAVLGAIGLIFGAKSLYIWFDSAAVAQDALLQGKSAYLNPTFFIIRLLVFFGLWLWFKFKIVGHSVQQDQDGQESHTVSNAALGVAFLLVFALSYSLFSVDTLMSLAPHWYSTIWGVYNFAGLFQSTLATIILLTIYSMNNGWLRGLVNENHIHDLAKYLKAFTIFYAYIAFSQFMLIWYANLPEETIFYLSRIEGGWLAVTISLFALKFAVPFLMLLPQKAKRTPPYLAMVCVLMLVMQFVDIYWMVYPNLSATHVTFGWQEIGAFLFFGGAFLWSVTNFLAKNNLVPIKDPRIQEAIHHHLTY